MARRARTTTDHLVAALDEAQRVGLALEQIDLRSVSPALRKVLKACVVAQREMVASVSEAIHQGAPARPQPVKPVPRKAPRRT